MAEQDRASFGVFPQLRRNRTVQDPEAAKNMPLDFLRGRVAGTLGMAGDIEGLGRMLIPNVSNEPVLPNTEYFQERLPLRNEAPASRGAENLGTLFASPAVLRTAANTPSILRRAAQDFALAGSPVNVIKPKGGNWFDNNLNKSIVDLKKAVMSDEQLADFASRHNRPVVDRYMQGHNADVALNNWVENTYKNYVKNEMATPEDRVRKMFDRRTEDVSKLEAKYEKDIEKLEAKLAKARLQPQSRENDQIVAYIERDIQNKIDQLNFDVSTAEQTIGHMGSLAEEARFPATGVSNVRDDMGFPREGMATSDIGKGWESLTDSLLGMKKAGNIGKLPETMERYPWLDKIDPETMVYKTQGDLNRYMGINHVMDILRQDLRSGALTPEKLTKMTMDQAIERTADFDRAAAVKMRQTAIRNTEGFPTYKEYPEGYKWIELAPPKELPAGYRVIQDEMGGGYKVVDEAGNEAVSTSTRPTNNLGHTNIPFHKTQEEAIADALKYDKRLEKALKYEGDTMGHCVGGYCPDVASGNTRIFSLRDRRGEPHVTVEVEGKPSWFTKADKTPDPSGKFKSFYELVDNERSEMAKQKGGFGNTGESFEQTANRLAEQYKLENIPSIIQIKGKQNLRPVAKYDPYTQDFVQSGNWDRVFDLQNTNLVDVKRSMIPWPANTRAEQIDNLVGGMEGGTKTPKFPSSDEFLNKAQQELGKRYVTQQEYDDWLLKQLTPDAPPPEMARGGPVHLSKGTKAAEIVEATAEGIAKLFNKYSGKAPKEEAMPLVLPRAAPKSSQEINEIAERVARQMIGEHVTPQGKTVNLAGRSKKEAERVKQLQFELKPTGTVAQAQVNKPQIGDVNVAFPGDQSISDTILATLQGETIDSLQQGGAKYGLGQKHLIDPEFWKSNIGPAQGIQGRIDDLYAKYMPERMVGEHLAMGPMSNNFAMHFADANLKALDWSKLKPRDVAIFDSHIADGYVIKKKNKTTGEVTTKHVKFPDWPGLASPDLAFEAMQKNPEMRKWFNNRMKTPDLTQPLGLPNGRDIEYAISEPAIRNLEINMTGLNTGILKPNAPVEPLGALHNTYTHRILGEAIGPREVLSPFTMSYPDATAHVLRTQNPSDFTGTIQKVFPHQVVDQQYLDEMGKYQDRVKQIVGYKEGGEVELPDLGFDDKESANLYKYAMKTLGLQGEQSGAGAGANIPLGGGNLNIGANFNKLSTMPNQMMQTLDASYGKNINGIGVNANVSKPMDVEGVYQGMLSGSIPVGLGRLMLGLQAQKTPYGSGVTGYTAGYQGKVGDGMLSATINQPRNRAASRSAQVQYQMPFAKGGAVEYNPAEIDKIALSLYEELYG